MRRTKRSSASSRAPTRRASARPAAHAAGRPHRLGAAMNMREGTAGPDLFVERGFLDPNTLAEVFAAVRASGGGPATVYGRGDSGVVDERVRRTTRVSPPAGVEELVRRLLLSRVGAAAEHFGLPLDEL